MAGTDTSGDQPFTTADEPRRKGDGSPEAGGRRRAGVALLALGALGVVFGDIGTSPLYALQTVFSADHHAVKPTEVDVYGVISLVFWSITLIVSIEFVRLHHAGRQRRRGRDHGPDRTARGALASASPRQGAADRPGHVRGRALLRRRHDHAGDLGPLRGRRSQGRDAQPELDRHSGHDRRAHGAVRDPALRHPGHRAGLRAGDAGLVRGDRGRRPRTGRSPTRRSSRRSRRNYGVEFFSAHSGIAFVSLARDRADDHRRRGALRGHGSLRAPADQPRLVLRRLPGADAQLHGPGLADPRQPRARSTTRSSC